MPDGTPPSALIVSRDANDAAAVQSFLLLSGLKAAVCNRMDAPGDFRRTKVVVIFPDDFSALAAALGVFRIARRFPGASVIVVTLDVIFFEAIARKLGESSPARVFVLPRPIWGWVLLDRVLSSRQSNPSTQRASDASMRR